VLQSNWYYGNVFDLKKMEEPYKPYVKLYNDLEVMAMIRCQRQQPLKSENFVLTVTTVKKLLILQGSRIHDAPWRPPLKLNRQTQGSNSPGKQSNKKIKS
jgi:hypothetical protein